jgi:diguanylate cyclase (GGDEF)-like protein/PAS domain S-box-containing protein
MDIRSSPHFSMGVIKIPSPLWHAIPAVVFIVLVGVTSLAYQFTERNSQANARAYFSFRVRDALTRIDLRMQTYQQVLHGAAALFDASGQVERDEFRTYVDRLRLSDHFPGIQGVGFALKIPAAAKEAHERSVRKEGFPAYAIRPEGQREVYTSIIYLEPFSQRNLRAFGYDMFSEPVRNAAMQRAVDEAMVAMSGKVRLVQESGVQEQAGFLVYEPIFDKAAPHETVAQRREMALGWVYAPFRMDDFMQGLLGERSQDLAISIYNGSAQNAADLMYDSGDKLEETHLAGHGFAFVTTSVFAGQTWTIKINARQSILALIESRLSLWVGGFGLTIALLMTALTWTLIFGRDRAYRFAREMNRALGSERFRLAAILEGTQVGTWEWNVSTGEIICNSQWAHIVGYTLDELAPLSIETWDRLCHPDDLKLSGALLEKCFSRDAPYYECEVRMRHKDGHWVWVLDRGKVATWTPDGKPLMMYGTHQDIAALKEREERSRFAADHDPMTGLPNRRLYEDRLGQELLQAHRAHTSLALMYVDLDDFKSINDTHGHAAGDLVLTTLSARMVACVRATDSVARIGGDEFVVLLPAILDGAHALGLAEKLLEAVRQPIDLAGTPLKVSVSIGVAIFPDHGSTPEKLAQHADAAMYLAKNSGRNTVRFYQAPAST